MGFSYTQKMDISWRRILNVSFSRSHKCVRKINEVESHWEKFSIIKVYGCSGKIMYTYIFSYKLVYRLWSFEFYIIFMLLLLHQMKLPFKYTFLDIFLQLNNLLLLTNYLQYINVNRMSERSFFKGLWIGIFLKIL